MENLRKEKMTPWDKEMHTVWAEDKIQDEEEEELEPVEDEDRDEYDEPEDEDEEEG